MSLACAKIGCPLRLTRRRCYHVSNQHDHYISPVSPGQP